MALFFPPIPIASANLAWNVATTGSDSNSGTASSPFRTIQKAINVARFYDWQNLYFPTINIATGTYNEQVLLPILFNCPNGGVLVGNTTTPANVVISDLGTNYAITTAMYATWYVQGIKTAGTYGSFSFGYYSTTFLHNINISGNLSQNIFLQGNLSSVVCGVSGATLGTSINISATAAGGLLFSRGTFVADATSITFANAITFANFVISLDATLAFFAFYTGSFVNPLNVTCTAGAASSLIIANGARFEGNSSSLSGGSALTRTNFPGGGAMIDGWSVFQPDLSNAYNTAGAVAFADTNGVLRMDYNITQAGNWTISGANNTMSIIGSASVSPSFGLNDTPKGGTQWAIYSAGNFITPIDFSSGSFYEPWQSGYTTWVFAGGVVLGWSNTTTQASTTNDTGLARNAVGVVEVNNGTKGTLADILARTTRTTAVAFASRPGTPVEGMVMAFTDSNTNVWGATIAAGGANHVLGYYNGTNWTVAAK